MSNCPRCEAELHAEDPGGLCPRCLIQAAFDTSLSPEEHLTQTLVADSDDQFGSYRILRLLGEGGMGTVYLAEQLVPIRRRVALKVIKLGMDTRQVLARFANERQALAVMDHPNIARILDAGATAKGRPYFVMEYIEGTPITDYCDGRQMPVRERLHLLLSVCRAVQHAHLKGVIHRDLKPSNVLVKDQEGEPLPKVIDFGIAKATDQHAVETTLLTEFGQIIGTPEYASPEQADVRIGSVDEISDVYSLGVLLYELVVGAVPFEAAKIRSGGLAEMLRIIREDDAPPLTAKLKAMGTAVTGIAAQRQTDPASLRRLLEGDLNSITLKALQKVRDRRYSSVAELAADIQRYLDRRPVLASPPGAVQRARDFLRTRGASLFGKATTVSGAPHSKSPPAKKISLVLEAFTNSTGDPAFDETLRRTVELELGNSPGISLLPDARVRETLGYMVQPADARLTPHIASEICERTGSAAVVEGWITRLGNQYVSGLRAKDCRTGEILYEEQTPASKKNEVFKALAGMASRFAAQAEKLTPRLQADPSLPADVTTPSLEAWRSYSAAMREFQAKAQTSESVALLKRAIEIDPVFAMAHATLGRAHADVGQTELAAEHVGRAHELRAGVSDRENYHITFTYHRQLTRNLELCRQSLESWARKYPKDLLPHGYLSGFTSPGTGRYDKAIEEGLKAIEIDPDFAIGYENVAFAYLHLNRLTEAEALLHKASKRRIEVVQFSLVRYYIAFLRNDEEAMEKEVTVRRAKHEAQGWFEHQEALTLAYRGQLEEANRLSARAISLARQAGLAGRAAMFQGSAAVWNAWLGNPTEALRNAEASLSLLRSRDADYGPALALALVGDSDKALDIAAELETRYPDDTSVQFSYVPTLRGLHALRHDEPAKALEMTQAAAAYDLAVPGTAYFTGASFFGALYPVYVRGLARARLGHHQEAAAEFQKILDHPGLVLNDSVGPTARLQLATLLTYEITKEPAAP